MFPRLSLFILSVVLAAGTVKAPVKPLIDSTYHIGQETVVDRDLCSATAVGPHALLTATHCELGSEVLFVEGEANPLGIIGRIRDGRDHTIYLLNGPEFLSYVDIDESDPLEPGEDVEFFGYPGELGKMLRKGYVVGNLKAENFLDPTPIRVLFSMISFYGDSGSGIFNNSGKIVAVITGSIQQRNAPTNREIQFSYSFKLKFSPEDLKRAHDFKGTN